MKYCSASVVVYNEKPNNVARFIQMFSHIPLVIVDNSPDDRLRNMCTKHSHVVYLFSGKNVGFGSGHNIALNFLRKQQSLGDYHLILNPDVGFSIEIIKPMIEFMQKHLAIGILSPRILNEDGSLQPQCRLLPTFLDMISRRILKGNALRWFNAKHELHHSGYDSILHVPFIQGSFWMVRSKVFEEVGMFDEQFFLYMEDVDFCRRVNEKYSVVFYPFVSATHQWQRGSQKNKKLFFLHVKSMIQYFNKWGWFIDIKRKTLNKKCLDNVCKHRELT